MSADDRRGPSSPQAGLELTWSAEISIEDILAATDRRARYLAGEDIPGRPQRGRSRDARSQREAPSDSVPAAMDTSNMTADGGVTPRDLVADDPLGDEDMEAALSDAGSRVALAGLAGHAIVEPGPALAGWLSCAPAADLDDAGLVTSIGSWRKVTSWAQAQELAAIAELARRRGAGADAASDQDPIQKMEAEFAPSELALALTLTQRGAEYWMDLAVSMTRRLPRTTAALSSGRIDLARAKLIEAFTTCLDDDLAGHVERRVLDKAEHQTTGQLRASLQRAVIVADPAAAERRREEAERNARVELSGDPEGTGSIAGRFLPAGHAAAAWSRISAMAKAMQSAGAAGGIDLLRAQVFVGLLLGTLPLIPPPLDEPGNDGAGGGSGPVEGGGSGPNDEGGSGPDDSGGSGPDDGGTGPDDGGTGPDDGGTGPDQGGGSGPDDNGGPLVDPDSADRPWLAQPRDEDAPPESDEPDEPDDCDSVDGIRDVGPPECRIRAGPAQSAWPEIPLPGTIPAPGCARGWLAGIPPPNHAARKGQAGKGRPRMGEAGKGQAGMGQPGKGQAGKGHAGSGALAGAMKLAVPLRTLAGLSGEPGQLGRLGAVTGQVARALANAAAANPACEWKIIVIGPSGEAIAIARLDKRCKNQARIGQVVRRSPGWVAQIILTVRTADLAAGVLPSRAESGGSAGLGYLLDAALDAAAKAARAADRAALGPASQVARSVPSASPSTGCGHVGAVSSYRIPESMRRLIEARDQTCRYPICRQPASRTDMDHTIPYDLGGPTCRCNVSAGCRHHHRLKQLKSWQLRQPTPGVLVWTTPARLTYTVEPDPHPA